MKSGKISYFSRTLFPSLVYVSLLLDSAFWKKEEEEEEEEEEKEKERNLTFRENRRDRSFSAWNFLSMVNFAVSSNLASALGTSWRPFSQTERNMRRNRYDSLAPRFLCL